jgi:IclR family transcriptional regulator, KDG regulon repressor
MCSARGHYHSRLEPLPGAKISWQLEALLLTSHLAYLSRQTRRTRQFSNGARIVEATAATEAPSVMSSVKRSLEVLETVVRADAPMTHAELAHKLEIPKSTLSQILATLVEVGYLTAIRREYTPGPRLVSLGYRTAHSDALRHGFRPALEGLAHATGETVLLGVPIGLQVMYAEQVPSPHPIRYVARLGALRPMHCTAMGRIFLAYGGLSARLIPPTELTRLTPATVVDVEQLDRILATIRDRGYAVNRGESVVGVSAIAAPVLNAVKEAIAAIAVVGPSERMADMEATIWPRLRATVDGLRT